MKNCISFEKISQLIELKIVARNLNSPRFDIFGWIPFYTVVFFYSANNNDFP